MTPERLREIEKLFHEARERPQAEREEMLADAGARDPALRREVESLLQVASGGIVDMPAVALAAGMVPPTPPRLLPGSSIGPYRIDHLLGAGGMGEVYRARDAALGRDVAIKILPGDLTNDAERLARFEREARVLAAFSHPHIAAIHGIVEQGDVRGLVLELVEGTTLADRLKRGRLPIRDALQIARQVALALEAAHEKGVVHRDLKPANIRITPDGLVKVIDFGLARTIESGTGPSADRTQPGLIVGTPSYMSPEQARGQRVDRRADIWAFGCVLYEMLTGSHPFAADTASDTIARVLGQEPDYAALPANLPVAIRRLIERCLNKDPSQRLHDVADARLDLDDALSGSPPVGSAAPRGKASAGRWIVVAALGAAAIAAALTLGRSRAPAPVGLLEFPIDITDSGGLGVAVSPDGRQVAFGNFGDKGAAVWVHSLETGVTKRLAPQAMEPFWSPDGSSVAYFVFDGIKRTDLASGSTSDVCAANAPAGGTWNADGVMLFSAESKLYRVAAGGGTPSEVQLTDDEGSPALRTFPQFLPDGRHFLYHAAGRNGNAVRVGSLDSRETKPLLVSDYPAVFAPPSYLLFLRGTSLVAQALNLKTLELEGQPSTVASGAAPGMLLGPPGRLIEFSASANVLALMKSLGGGAGHLVWFDRSGRSIGSIAGPTDGEYLNPSISPDGTRVAVNRMDPVTGNWDVWIVDAARNVASRLTSDPAVDADPVWSPDGREIAFASTRSGRYGLYRKVVDGSGPAELLRLIDEPTEWFVVTDWSLPRQLVLFNLTVANRTTSVRALPLDGDRRPFRVLPDGFIRYGARLSPDGRWIAYSSTESGTYEIYVERFMAPGEKKRISEGGGVHPRWTSGGRELVFWSLRGGIEAVDVESSGSTLRVSAPRTLISAPVLTLVDGRTHYDVTRDGRRFLLRQPIGLERPTISVTVNWTEKLKR